MPATPTPAPMPDPTTSTAPTTGARGADDVVVAVDVIEDYGDSALLVSLSRGDREQRWAAAQRLTHGLRERRIPGLIEAIAGFDTVYLHFDPLTLSHRQLRQVLAEIPPDVTPIPPLGRRWVIPVLYGGADGPDLAEVAAQLGCTEPEVIDLHRGTAWVIRMLASPAGAPLTDAVPGAACLPRPVSRLSTPRVRLAAGSVGLSGQQCIVYPVVGPGGWRIIGRTPLRLADPQRDPLVAYRPGDLLRFVPITADQAPRWTGPLHDLDPQLTEAFDDG